MRFLLAALIGVAAACAPAVRPVEIAPVDPPKLTLPAQEDSIRFAVIGDTGTGGPAQRDRSRAAGQTDLRDGSRRRELVGRQHHGLPLVVRQAMDLAVRALELEGGRGIADLEGGGGGWLRAGALTACGSTVSPTRTETPPGPPAPAASAAGRSCATSTSPRMRPSRRSSPSGVTFPDSAIRRAFPPSAGMTQMSPPVGGTPKFS